MAANRRFFSPSLSARRLPTWQIIVDHRANARSSNYARRLDRRTGVWIKSLAKVNRQSACCVREDTISIAGDPFHRRYRAISFESRIIHRLQIVFPTFSPSVANVATRLMGFSRAEYHPTWIAARYTYNRAIAIKKILDKGTLKNSRAAGLDNSLSG